MDDSRFISNDIVLDILNRVKAVFEAEKALTQAHFEQIAREVRIDWRGERPYIGCYSSTTMAMSARRREIIKMVRAGESFQFIGRKFGISKQRAFKIYKGD